jgi:signal transduction histidine kinase
MDQFIKQKKIGWVSFFGMFPIFLVNIYLLCFYNLSTCLNSTIINVVFSFTTSLIFLISIFKHNSFFRALQIFNFILISIFTSIVNKNPSDVTAIVFFAYAILLFWSYYKNRLKLYHIIIFSLAIFSSIIIFRMAIGDLLNIVLYNKIDFSSCLFVIKNDFTKILAEWIPVLAFLELFIGIIWVALIEELKKYFNKSEKIEKELHQNEPYIWYGKNVTGVIHNIRNKISPMYLLLEDLSQNKDMDKESKKFIKSQIRSTDNICDLLDQLLLVVKNKNIEASTPTNINKLIDSIMEFFKSNLEFKHNVDLEKKYIGRDLILKVNPLEFTQVVENMIKNSWDALKDKKGSKKIIIKVKNGIEKSLSVEDNGTGIEWCYNCTNKKCFSESCDKFKVGKTTKENGLGYGMKFIENFVRENNFKGEINSEKNKGTEVKIYFKKSIKNKNE